MVRLNPPAKATTNGDDEGQRRTARTKGNSDGNGKVRRAGGATGYQIRVDRGGVLRR